ncbi:flagellar hook-length control protein FliK [Ochrobactrum pecoris]|uniref:Chemotaxis protein MotD n=1 Tax=Brucella pecoris TaxID=867683 RepID=A0A5C5CHA2_9HYPH|nr:flagellar hook-length control protein FliK [Brucella pecoris]MBB4095098.1 chemotaxis protein MotD [Brucella pecoris]NKW81740.1 flagellar hook-length control protein FliK [Brucella pecoris]TNV10670.1 flagellar hook-length control protein FliK [Brucella pecoris]
MSVDILLNSTSRLASLARNSGPSQAKAEGEGQDSADPAKLFSSLLEKPQGKVEKKGESEADVGSDAADAKEEEAVKPTVAFALPQNLLSLAVPSPDLKGTNHNFATANIAENGTKVSDPLSALIKEPDPKQLGEQGAEQHTDQSRQASETASSKTTVTPSVSGKADQAINPDTAKATGDNQAEGAGDDFASLLKTDKGQAQQQSGHQVPDRTDIQQQPTAKGTSPGDIKATTPSQAAARIADIQVVSERSFGTVKTLQIRLDPAELGAVTARIRIASEGVEVHLVAEKTHAAEALAADRSMIEKALKAAGIADDAKISVTVTDRNAAGAVQQAQAAQNAGQQSGQQQAFNMQQGFDGRNGTQARADLTGGEGRQNGESGQAGRERSDMQTSQDGGNGISRNDGRNRGLVV